MPTPPVAPRHPTSTTLHGETRTDDYAWLRDKVDPAVRAYLEAENAYAKAVTAHTRGLREQLFEEIAGRIRQTDESAPARKGPYWYARRTVEGLEYPIHVRHRGAADGPEEVLLDENALAEQTGYVALGAFALDREQRLLAYSVDVDGGEQFELHVRDLTTGEALADVIPRTYYGVEWAADARALLYVVTDESHRPHRVLRHTLGTPADTDIVVFEEPDERFYLSLHQTRSERFFVISVESKTTSEVALLPCDDPAGTPRVVRPREDGVEYHVEHQGERLLVLTNLGAVNFRLMEAPLPADLRATDAGPAEWSELIAGRDDVRLEDVEAFERHLVVVERRDARTVLRVIGADGSGDHLVEVPEEVSTVGVGANLEYDTDALRLGYTSLVTPRSTFDYDVGTRALRLVKRDEVLGGYDPERYETSRLWATAPDGTRVPMSVVHSRGIALDGSHPALLYGYGSYEACIDPTFSFARLSLLERGFVFAIAHVRGGGEMGRQWYDDGKLAAKEHTFTDFVACAEHLVATGYTAPERLAIRGGSAGGLLMGASTNLRPDLFAVVVAEVPFVDVLTTMLDETLPLTVTEWEEWGNPNNPADYAWIRAYSPYDNVEPGAYPAMYVSGGINDPRVGFWEPAKWVARLRTLRTDSRPMVLVTELGAGHFGPAGRYEAWRKEAEVLAFIVDNTRGSTGG